MCGRGKTDFVFIKPVPFLDDYVRGNQFREVVHDKTSKDFLKDVVHLFCVEMKQSDRIFQISERGLDAPAHSIEFFNFIGRESIGRQICDNGFVVVFR